MSRSNRPNRLFFRVELPEVDITKFKKEGPLQFDPKRLLVEKIKSRESDLKVSGEFALVIRYLGKDKIAPKIHTLCILGFDYTDGQFIFRQFQGVQGVSKAKSLFHSVDIVKYWQTYIRDFSHINHRTFKVSIDPQGIEDASLAARNRIAKLFQ